MTTLIAHGFVGDGGVASLSVSADCTGADYLRVWVYAEGGVAVSSVVRGAQNPTLIPSSAITDSWQGCYEQVAPTTGTASIDVTLSASSSRCFVYWSAWSGVDSTTPSGTPATATPSDVTLSITTPSSAGDVIEAVCMAVVDTLTLDTGAGAVQIDLAQDWLSVFRSFGSAYDVTEDETISWTPGFSTDGFLVGIPIIASGGTPGPSISNVDTDNAITATQAGWDVNGSGFDTATVDITQGTTVVAQTVNSQSSTAINCDTVFDAGAGPHLSYGDGVLEVTNGDAQADSILVQIGVPAGRAYVNLSTPNTTAANRITAVPDLASGDQLEISNVVGGSISDVSVATDATFDCSVAVTSFDVRCWAASDSTWGAIGTQDVSGIPPDPPVFMGTIPTLEFTQNVNVGTINLASYFTSVTSYSLNQALPTGLSFNTSTGALTGTPTGSGTFGGFVVTGSNLDGTADSNAFTISVASSQEFTSAGGRRRDGRGRGFMQYIWGRG